MKSVFPAGSVLICGGHNPAGDIDAGDVIVLPDARDAVLVKRVRLGQGGFIVTVVPVDDDRSEAERLVTLTAGIRLRKTSA
jgi:hypothetical protein